MTASRTTRTPAEGPAETRAETRASQASAWNTLASRALTSQALASQALASQAPELEEVMAGCDIERRSETLRRITDLFMATASQLGEAHIAVFDEVILRLSQGIEFRVRVELAERLADHANAPPETARSLAHDEDIAIAGPMIQRSPRLAEDDLVVLAEQRGQDHLRALSRRRTLSERITDVIVRRGDTQVVRLVAENEGARFSHAGFSQLVEKARVDVILQRMLQARCDIPAREMTILVEIAREKVRESLKSDSVGPAEELIDTTINKVAANVARGTNSRALVDDYSRASAAVAQRAWKAPISEQDIVEMLEGDRIDEALVALATVAQIPITMAGRAFHASHYDPLLFIVRAAAIGWETFQLLLINKAGRRPGDAVIAGAREAYERLSVETARRIVQLSLEKGRTLNVSAN
ncbi:MAG TPA: DUF2336 domain-containing protein [Saliniramus sp.]|nr:DUF2336 domain-containing protein [Saliniramus sp.]